jgi:DNA polymerase-1
MADVTDKRKKLAIIDGKSVFYRGYYAMPNLATRDGKPTGGVFGFATMALEVIRRLKPDYVAVAWDKPKTNIRRRLELYPEYKAGRKPAPADFYEQVPILHELLQAFGWPLYEMDDYEADDIMGALAVQATEKDIDTLLITSDMDMLQLVNDHVKVYALKTGLSNIELYSPASFEAKYGIKVEQFLDLKSLKGDSSDNIPGVPGIGEKGAVALLQEYETLDNVYENIGLLKDSVAKKLEAGKDLAYLSKKLAAIWTDAPLKLDLKEVDGSKSQPEKIMQLLQDLEFKSLARQLPEVLQVKIDAHHAAHGGPSLKVGKNTVIDTADQLKNWKLPDSKLLYMHSRCAGKHGRKPEVLVLSADGKATYTLDLRKLDHAAVAELLKDVKQVVGHDVKSTLKVLLELAKSDQPALKLDEKPRAQMQHAGSTPLPAVAHDTLIAGFVLNALRRDHGLSDMARTDLGYEGSDFEDMDTDEVISRSAEIIAIIHGLHNQQAKELKSTPGYQELVTDVEWPVIPVLARMEYIGIELDTKYLAKFADQIGDLISDYEQQIYGHADQEFNIGSPSQLAEILFEKLKLPTQGVKKGKTGYSTAAAELDKLRGQHPIIDLITQYREVAKLKNTYVDTLPQQVDENSRIHTTFSLTTAQTGRLSSLDPNLQNIPTRTDLGRHVRTAFVAGKGNKLVSADYSQFELRLAAYLADDKELIDMFNRDVDVHQATAAQVYGRELEDVTKQMRRQAKVVNFGILYGMSPHGLAVAAGMTFEQAQAFIKRYKELRQPLFDYMDRVKEQAIKDGYVATLLGRRRPMPDIHSSNFVVRQAAERAAINVPIQGTEADLVKLAMTRVDQKLRDQHNDCHMLLQIHDSILVECPAEVADRIADLLKEEMEAVYELPVKLTVDTTIGDNWGEL